jgi:hypothetical protein
MHPPLQSPHRSRATTQVQRTTSSLVFSLSCNHILFGKNSKRYKKGRSNKVLWAILPYCHLTLTLEVHLSPLSPPFKRQSQTKQITWSCKPGGINSVAISPRLIILTPISSPGIVSGTWCGTFENKQVHLSQILPWNVAVAGTYRGLVWAFLTTSGYPCPLGIFEQQSTCEFSIKRSNKETICKRRSVRKDILQSIIETPNVALLQYLHWKILRIVFKRAVSVQIQFHNNKLLTLHGLTLGLHHQYKDIWLRMKWYIGET